MRKIITVLLILLLMSGAAYGSVSEDNSVYLRKDVFDAKMEAFMSEIRLMNEQLRSDIRALDSRIGGVEQSVNTRLDSVEKSLNSRISSVEQSLNSRLDGVEKRMSSLEIMIYWILGTLSVAFAALALTPYLKEIRRPSLTLEDVKRLIESNNAMLERKFSGMTPPF